jgi:biopolymer transport protein ExbD
MAIKKRNKITTEFSMASMTDIVFLLLLFFMLTSTLVTTNALDLLLPNSKVVKTKEHPVVSVSIDKDLHYYIDRDLVEPAFIEALLLKKLGTEQEPSIVLRVEQSVPIEHAVFVMDIANQNKIKVVLATKPKK